MEGPGSKRGRAEGVRGVSWRDREVQDLLDIWGEEKLQAALRSSHRNIDIFRDIARRMAELGHDRTAEECRSKTKTMRMEYRRVLAHNSQTGNAPATCPYFEELDRILHGDGSAQPTTLVKSIRFGPSSQSSADAAPGPSGSGETPRGAGTQRPSTVAPHTSGSSAGTARPRRAEAGRRRHGRPPLAASRELGGAARPPSVAAAEDEEEEEEEDDDETQIDEGDDSGPGDVEDDEDGSSPDEGSSAQATPEGDEQDAGSQQPPPQGRGLALPRDRRRPPRPRAVAERVMAHSKQLLRMDIAARRAEAEEEQQRYFQEQRRRDEEFYAEQRRRAEAEEQQRMERQRQYQEAQERHEEVLRAAVEALRALTARASLGQAAHQTPPPSPGPPAHPDPDPAGPAAPQAEPMEAPRRRRLSEAGSPTSGSVPRRRARSEAGAPTPGAQARQASRRRTRGRARSLGSGDRATRNPGRGRRTPRGRVPSSPPH